MNKHILVVDCGSTGIRSLIIDQNGKIVHRTYKKIEILHPEPGGTENNPEHIWESFRDIVKKGINLPLIKIDAIAITNQRSTFTLWDSRDGEPLINFINWQDIRAMDTVRKMNRNPIWRTLRTVAFFIGRLIRNPLLIVTSMLKLNTDHTLCKLKWVLDNNPNIKEKCKKNEVMFGTIDSWLVYRLSGKKDHITDYTNAAATTLLNPFMMKWNTLFCKIFKIPMNILPKVCNTNDYLSNTDHTIFGKTIPVTCVVGDQQASLFGHRCFNKGDVKISLGSGAFVSMNVGYKPKFSTKGLFPLIAWTFKGIPQYELEGQVATVGTFIDWVVDKVKLFKSPQELDKFATECTDSKGLFVVPTLTGIRFPYFKPELKASFSGLSLLTEKKHIARGIIEGIAHRVVDIIDGMETETKIAITSIRVDGGVTNSDVLMQCLADFSGKEIYRSDESDLASIGAAYFAGLAIGVWASREEISQMKIPHKKFMPSMTVLDRQNRRNIWKKHIISVQKQYKL
ncbi:MAG: FGGY family carbohydrate kinase [Spirochaetaceae bacterium]